MYVDVLFRSLDHPSVPKTFDIRKFADAYVCLQTLAEARHVYAMAQRCALPLLTPTCSSSTA